MYTIKKKRKIFVTTIKFLYSVDLGGSLTNVIKGAGVRDHVEWGRRAARRGAVTMADLTVTNVPHYPQTMMNNPP